MKSLLFVVPTFEVGGIEVFIKNLSKKLAGKFDIGLLILSRQVDKQLIESISNKVSIYDFNDYIYCPHYLKNINVFLNTLMPLKLKKIKSLFADFDYIHSVDSTTNELCMRILMKIERNDITLTTGVYHSKEFLWNLHPAYFRNIQKKQFKLIPKTNIYIANQEVAQIYSNTLESNYVDCPCFPFGIDISVHKNLFPKFNSNKIIMVGRLVNFKNYQLNLIKKFSEIALSEKGYELHYYGFGPFEDQLRQAAIDNNVKVHFHGVIKSELLPRILADSFLFVGGALSIIEATAVGVPSIVGIESEERDLTYGFFSDIKGDSYNRNDLDLEQQSLEKMLKYAINLSASEYQKLVEKHKEKSQRYDIETCANSFKIFIESSNHQISFLKYNLLRYKLSQLLWVSLNVIGINKSIKNRYHDDIKH